ncbi:MAG: bifunctional indole-3-glycerol-phosphate synthase TrpC/phosphoribosylanthranilate isomerase TrpF [Gammaproteobacteria bacterium]|nr:MAG: bifunctional indole-3-glycerol-phosphate synthase TrpC/phosphoribosylanthranilate isomerase TrpF [Gammaproteobacteria bacterium]
MTSVLETIVANKKLEVAAGKYQSLDGPITKSKRSLKDSLMSRAPGLILECKSASPSKGLIAKNYQPAQLAKSYQPFAAGVSVLTDEKYFQGNMNHLKTVTQTTHLPVLCKDFVISKEQIICARSYGADAILLMLSVLTNALYIDLAEQAKLLDMDILTEVHNEQELDRAIQLDAMIIGINNRDLGTLKIDMATTARLASKVPKHCLMISESGYSSNQQINNAFSNKRSPDGFLVGSHLSASDNTDLALRGLLFGQIKICGLKHIEEAQAAFDNGASYGGLIFSKKSPRYIEPDEALELTKVPLQWVGVFTELVLDNSDEDIPSISRRLKLKAVQIHCSASEQQLSDLRARLPDDCEIWLLVRVNQNTLSASQVLLTSPSVQRFLLEPEGKLAGGNGTSFNWDLLQSLNLDKNKIVLAGGINPDNILEAHKTAASIIDVNSGVEDRPGVKSATKIAHLFKQLLPGKKL